MRLQGQAVEGVLTLCTRRQARHIKRQGFGGETGLAHVNDYLAVGHCLKGDQSGRDLGAQRVARRELLLMDEFDETARAVAAVLDLAAIGVENPVAKIRLGVRGRVDQQYLIAANAELAVSEGPGAFGGHVDGLAHPVQDHEIVAGAMHFCEVPDHVGIIAHLFAVLT